MVQLKAETVDVFGTFATNASLVHDVIDIYCRAQNCNTHG